jgi:hypothetical protein
MPIFVAVGGRKANYLVDLPPMDVHLADRVLPDRIKGTINDNKDVA